MNNLVSICIPTYNGAQFIAEALESAILQTYPNIEIIISDDKSTDSTLKIINSFKDKTSIPIKIYHHNPSGIGANWNNSIKKASGKYIKFLFQDDILLPNCVEEMVEMIEKDKSIGMVASKRDFIIEKSFVSDDTKKWIKTYGDLQKSLQLPSKDGISIFDKTLFKSKKFLKSPLNKIGEPSVFLFRKDIVNKIGYFREDLKQILDYEFCYRLLKYKNIAVLDKKLVKFRLHDKQATNLNRGNDNTDYIKYNELIYKKYLWHLNTKTKIYLLEKNNIIFRLLMTILRKIKNWK